MRGETGHLRKKKVKETVWVKCKECWGGTYGKCDGRRAGNWVAKSSSFIKMSTVKAAYVAPSGLCTDSGPAISPGTSLELLKYGYRSSIDIYDGQTTL